jgi:hypothetical protein
VSLPSTSWIQERFRSAYSLMIAAVGDDVTLMLRNAGGTFDNVGPLKAKVSELRLQDIVVGSTARVGDLRVILLAGSIPAGQRRMESKDRVLWRAREYAVVQYDDATASIGAEVMAVNIIVRG